MAKQQRTKKELLEAWKNQEQQAKEENDKKRKKCKFCKLSWYRFIPPTGSFSEPSEYCGCRKKGSLVDPNGICDDFENE